MIGYINGKVVGYMLDKLIVKTANGLGHLVAIGEQNRPMKNDTVEYYVLEVRREDRNDLYGFVEIKDREWVETLMKVNGVGPKMAATIVYALGWETVHAAIADEDYKALSSVKGLGVKTAKKIVLELKGEATDIGAMSDGEVDMRDNTVANFTEALTNLGYNKQQIVYLITQMKKDGVWDGGDMVGMVRLGLKYQNGGR